MYPHNLRSESMDLSPLLMVRFLQNRWRRGCLLLVTISRRRKESEITMDSQHVAEMTARWENDARWRDVKRPYSAEDVCKLRGSIQIEYTLARLGAERLWS